MEGEPIIALLQAERGLEDHGDGASGIDGEREVLVVAVDVAAGSGLTVQEYPLADRHRGIAHVELRQHLSLQQQRGREQKEQAMAERGAHDFGFRGYRP